MYSKEQYRVGIRFRQIANSIYEMNWVQVLSVSVAPHNFIPACDGQLLALPYKSRGTLGLWDLANLSEEPLILCGHAWSITAISLSNGSNPKLLCSCADDYLIIWNLDKALQDIEDGCNPKGESLIESPGKIQHCRFLPDDRMIALSVDKEINLYSSKDFSLIATLEGHLAKVTGVATCGHFPDLLISVSEDRTFKVWNTDKLKVEYQSNIISGSSILTVTCDDESPRFAIGTIDGNIWIFDLSPGSHYRLLAHVDIAKSASQLFKSNLTSDIPAGTMRNQYNNSKFKGIEKTAYESPDQTQSQFSVLGFQFCKPVPEQDRSTEPFDVWQKHNAIKDVLSPAPTLLVGLTNAVVSLNLRTLEVDMIANLQEFLISKSPGDVEVVGLAGSVLFSKAEVDNKVWCIIGNLFQNNVHINSIHVSCDEVSTSKDDKEMELLQADVETFQINNETKEDNLSLSIIASGPMQASSCLREVFRPSTDKKNLKKKSSREKLKDLSKGGNREICFHSRIRSSGYLSSPRTTMITYKSNSNQTVESRYTESTSSSGNIFKKLYQEYPMNDALPTAAKHSLQLLEKSAGITTMKFSGDGNSLACSTTMSSAHVIKPSGKVVDLIGHNGVVNSVHFNMDGTQLLTSSDDKTARLWSWKTQDVIITFQTIHSSHNALKDISAAGQANPLFNKEIKNTQFYYMDKFILLSSGNSLYLYKYFINPNKCELKRFKSQGRYKLVKEFPLPSQQIMCVGAVNQFHSYLVFCACSDKSVRVLDMNAGEIAQVFPEVHSRPPYAICLNEGSAFVSQPPNAYDLFLTAAASDGIKLWDLRGNRCVQRYQGNVNRALHCGLSFSPCARYFACGSEDKAAYLFDLRQGTYVHKLAGHTDVVSDVEYKPDEPQLVTATNDGILTLFTP